MTVFKRFRPKDAYPAIYVGLGIVFILVSFVFYAALTDKYSASTLSQFLLGVILVMVFGMALVIGIKHKETIYPKVNYVDYHENKVEFIMAMIAHVVFIIFGLYIISRAVAPSLIPKLF